MHADCSAPLAGVVALVEDERIPCKEEIEEKDGMVK